MIHYADTYAHNRYPDAQAVTDLAEQMLNADHWGADVGPDERHRYANWLLLRRAAYARGVR